MSPLALIVGASSPIGAAIAAELASLRYDLLLWGRDQSTLEGVARRCRDTTVHTQLVDITDLDQIHGSIRAIDNLGTLTFVVFAAGVFDWGPLDQADPARAQQSIVVNLAAAATITTFTLPALIAAQPSALIYIGSGASHTPYANNAAYVAAKHGLAGLARSVFLDVRDRGVKVSLISPGMVAAGASLTSSADPARMLQPADVAAAVRFVVTFPNRGCPTEIRLQPQRNPTQSDPSDAG